jgi:GT2 family glycosyltransferase
MRGMSGTAPQWMKDVAGTNISYKKYLFLKYGSFIKETYCSDTEFHWRLAKDGIRIRFDPNLRVTHHSIDTLERFLRHERFHGKCFAKVRSRAWEFSKFKGFIYAFLSLFLPLKLFWKVFFLNYKKKIYWLRFLGSLPLLALGIISWSFGEVEGYIRSEKRL